MSGEQDLSILLASLEPLLASENYVFCCVKDKELLDTLKGDLLSLYYEEEGPTVIICEAKAIEYKLHYQSTFARISLKVHSSLDAVGLTAAVSHALAKENISANVVAAYYHDHIFVPHDRAKDALACLKTLSLQPLKNRQ